MTVAFTLPMVEATDANPPASRKIMHMVMMLISPTPERNTPIFVQIILALKDGEHDGGMIATVAES